MFSSGGGGCHEIEVRRSSLLAIRRNEPTAGKQLTLKAQSGALGIGGR
jgi:hypothetical protein